MRCSSDSWIVWIVLIFRCDVCPSYYWANEQGGALVSLWVFLATMGVGMRR